MNKNIDNARKNAGEKSSEKNVWRKPKGIKVQGYSMKGKMIMKFKKCMNDCVKSWTTDESGFNSLIG